jgi:hypothetical protein
MNVRFWRKAEIGQTDGECPLMTADSMDERNTF